MDLLGTFAQFVPRMLLETKKAGSATNDKSPKISLDKVRRDRYNFSFQKIGKNYILD